MTDDAHIPRSWGGGATIRDMFRVLREPDMGNEAVHTLYPMKQRLSSAIRKLPEISADPEPGVPLQITPHTSTETFTVFAPKLVHGSNVRVRFKRFTPNSGPGRREQWDWSTARTSMRNLYLRETERGRKPDLVAELRLHFERIDKTSVPHDRTLRMHVKDWREEGDYLPGHD